MSLDYEFAPIDVDIITHPKIAEIASKLRGAAFGLWVWGQCYARLHKTLGHLRRSAVLVALGLPTPLILACAAELQRVGLWVVRDDLSWDIYNFDRKTAGGSKPSSTPRVQRHREKKRNASPVPDETHETRFSETSASYSRSVSSGSGSLGEIQEPEAKPSPRARPGAVAIDDDLIGWAVTAGAPEPTPSRLEAYELYLAENGRAVADRRAGFKRWLLGEKRFADRAPVSKVRSLTQSGDDRCYDIPAELR